MTIETRQNQTFEANFVKQKYATDILSEKCKTELII